MTDHFEPPGLDAEFVYKASRSGGKGGQNVNKVNTRVQVEFAVADSRILTGEEKAVILDKLAARISQEGTLLVTAQEERSQAGNRERARQKMYALLNRAFVERKKRKPTKPTSASVERRLKMKKRESERKQLRRFEG